MNLKEIELLVRQAKENNAQAKHELLEQFKPFIVKKAMSTFIKGYDLCDLIQEGNKSLLHAAALYDTTKNCFVCYAYKSIINNYNSMIRSSIKKYTVVSYNAPTEDEIEFIEMFASNFNLEKDFEDKEELLLLNVALKKLTPEELELIDFIYFKNHSIAEYAQFKKINYYTCVRKKNRVLDKLKCLM